MWDWEAEFSQGQPCTPVISQHCQFCKIHLRGEGAKVLHATRSSFSHFPRRKLWEQYWGPLGCHLARTVSRVQESHSISLSPQILNTETQLIRSSQSSCPCTLLLPWLAFRFKGELGIFHEIYNCRIRFFTKQRMNHNTYLPFLRFILEEIKHVGAFLQYQANNMMWHTEK